MMRSVFPFLILLLLSLLWQQCTTPSIVATQAIQKGDALNNQNRYEESIPHYESYLRQSGQLGIYRNPTQEAEVCRKLAYAHSTQGRYSRALHYLDKAVAIDSLLPQNQLQMVENYRQIGMVQAYAGDFPASLKYLQGSLQRNEGMIGSAKTLKQQSVADTHLALARVHLTLGNYAPSQHHAQVARQLFTKIPGGQAGEMEAVLVLGIIWRDRGDLHKAEQQLETSRKMAESLGLNTSRHWQALGEVFLIQGDFQKAVQFKSQAIDQAIATGILPQTIIAYLRLGDVYRQMGDDVRATREYNKALELQTKMAATDTLASRLRTGDDLLAVYDFQVRSGSSLGAGLVSLRLAEAAREQKEWAQSSQFLHQAIGYFTTSGATEGLAKAYLGLAKIAIEEGKPELGWEWAEKAENATIQPDLKWQVYVEMGKAKEGQQQLMEARKFYEKSVAVIDGMRANLTVDELKTTFANTKVEVYDRLIMLLVKHRNSWTDLSEREALEKAFQYSELARSRTFLDMLGNKAIGARVSTDTLLLNQEQMQRLKMNRLVQEINRSGSESESRPALLKELAQVQSSHEQLLERIKLMNPAYGTLVAVNPPAVSEIQAGLQPHEILVKYWVSTDQLLIWTLSKKQLKLRIVAISRRDIHQLVNTARRGIMLQLEVGNQALSNLYQHLIQPIAQELEAYSHLVIVPHRSLHFLPFQALQGADGKFLIERHVLSYAPSAAVHQYCRQLETRQEQSLLGVALGNTAIGDFAPLPGTKLEVNQLKGIYEQVTLQMEERFTEEFFKSQSGKYSYIHIATHGVFNKQQPLYSYLLMGEGPADDGRLTVNEIFNLQLQSRVVTLSACETGLGEIGEADDLVGLSRAFLFAGSPGVVVSLWKVDDVTTAYLMTRFNQYLQAGVRTDEALTYAQRDLLQRNMKGSTVRGFKEVKLDEQIASGVLGKSTETTRSPYFWAPFVLIGDGSVR